MKKILLSMGLIAMAFNLSSCVKNDGVNPSVETKGDFEIYASISRTENDGMNTVWSAGDKINVFHAEADTEDYVNDTPYDGSVGYPFVCEDAAAGVFKGTLASVLEPGVEYNWFVFYPYSSFIETPADKTKGYMPVGCKANEVQTQTGNNSMAHIAGPNYPMSGRRFNIPSEVAPNIEFTHLSSLVEFEVKNSLTEAITISKIQFTAEEDIVGTYFINFVDADDLKFTPSGDTYVSKTATLAVTNGEAIAAGASAKFYMAVKPFTAAAGSTLAIKVLAASETGNGVHEKTVTLTNASTFSAGKIKNVKVNYNTEIVAPVVPEEGELPEGWTDNAYNLVTSASYLKVGDKVVFVASDYNYAMGAQSGNNRPHVAVTKNTDKNTVDITSEVTIFTVETGNKDNTFAFKTSTSKYIYAASSGSNYLKEEDALTDNSSWSVSIADGVATVVAQGTNTRNTLRYNDQSSLFSCYASGQNDVSIYKLAGTYVMPISIVAEDASVGADATTGEIKLTLTNDSGWVISATADADWISNIAYANSKVTFDVDENVETAVRKASVTITAKRDGFNDVVATAEVVQDGKSVGGPKTYTLTITKDNFNTTSYAANNNDKTTNAVAEDGSTMEVKWCSYQVMQSEGVTQWQKSKGYIYNKTDLGTITNVEVTTTSGSFTKYIGSSQQPGTNGSGGYFQVKVGSATGKTSKVVVTFTK